MGEIETVAPWGWLPASDLTKQCFAKGERELESCFVSLEQTHDNITVRDSWFHGMVPSVAWYE